MRDYEHILKIKSALRGKLEDLALQIPLIWYKRRNELRDYEHILKIKSALRGKPRDLTLQSRFTFLRR